MPVPRGVATVVETVAVGALVVVGAVEVTTSTATSGPVTVHLLTLLVLGTAVLLRHRAPLPVLLVAAVAVVVQNVLGWAPSAAELVLFLVLVVAAASQPVGRVRVTTTSALAVAYLAVLLRDPALGTLAAALPSLVLLAAATGVGAVLRHRAQAAAVAAAAARTAQERQAVEAERQLAEERARLARELHDVVTHSLSVVVVQAGALRLDAPPEQASRLAVIEGTARDALEEMRRLLGVLRGEEGGELAPQPGLEQVEGLVAQLRHAGVDTELRRLGQLRGLPPGVDLAAYRVVQEGVTNVLRHADASRVVVEVESGADGVRVSVADDGATRPPGTGISRPGRGLVGLSERLALYGGSLTHGPRPGGGYALAARIPVDPATARGAEART